MKKMVFKYLFLVMATGLGFHAFGMNKPEQQLAASELIQQWDELESNKRLSRFEKLLGDKEGAWSSKEDLLVRLWAQLPVEKRLGYLKTLFHKGTIKEQGALLVKMWEFIPDEERSSYFFQACGFAEEKSTTDRFYQREELFTKLIDKFSPYLRALFFNMIVGSEDSYVRRVRFFEQFGAKLDPQVFADSFVEFFEKATYYNYYGELDKSVSTAENLLECFGDKISGAHKIACIEKLGSYYNVARFWETIALSDRLPLLKKMWKILNGFEGGINDKVFGMESVMEKLDGKQAEEFFSYAIDTIPEHASLKLLFILWKKLSKEQQFCCLKKAWQSGTTKVKRVLLYNCIINQHARCPLAPEYHSKFMTFVLDNAGLLLHKATILSAFHKSFTKEECVSFGSSLLDLGMKPLSQFESQTISSELCKGVCEGLLKAVADRKLKGSFHDTSHILLFFTGDTRLHYFKKMFDSCKPKYKRAVLDITFKDVPENADVRSHYLERIKKECPFVA
ncbi:TPA: hypothetical protein DDZ86_01800 [Candidatus Dependentiae bacterium]|nr:MAG: hypothetical protein UW09_C0001G0277 [candidate division TM6 bacterium GW2011_GWF2_43_87]HBL98358.1 hypothetical protein [Candidatus Dependentiae bacterium]